MDAGTEPSKTQADIIQKHSKDEVLKILREENPPIREDGEYSQLIIVLETKKISSNLGIFKGEYYQDDKLEYRGSLLVPIVPSNQKNWAELKDGESSFYGFTLDSREMTLPEKIKDFINRSLEESTIPDFIPFARKKEKE